MSKKKRQLKKEYEEQQLASYWNYMFKNAMVHKAPYTERWKTYMEAYNGEYFKKKNLPEYKSDFVANYIFSVVETIRPIMLDNDPKFQAMARQPHGMQFSNDLQEAYSYEWDREKMNRKLYRELITSLVCGTAVFFVPWDSKEKEIKAIPVSPFNIFPDPLATSVEDAEYIIYATYRNETLLKRMFPNKAEKLVGGDINYGELVNDNDENARIDNQILVLEVWTRDLQTFENEDGEIKPLYPNGRVITLCPELGIVLSDKKNPYQDKNFPFVLLKDYDVPGKFWGEGEVAQLLSPQVYMNELNNAIIDNAKATANMPWVIDKNSGIGFGKITNRPGLVIRKNPGTEVRREQPPSMPAYVINAVETMKNDMEQVSGIFDTLKGNSETGVYTAQGILALQEAGQARVRLKVKLMEDFLAELAQLWFSRMKQFWDEDRWVRIVRADGSYDFKKIKPETFNHNYDIKILAGSTMPVNRGAMLDLMIRLAQTVMPDGQALVDRQAVAEYLPQEVKSALLQRMQERESAVEEQIAQLTQMAQEIGQQLQQLAQESHQNDEQHFQMIEELTSGLEAVNKKILQLQQEHDKIIEEKKLEDERYKIRNEAYNQGFSDGEKLAKSQTNIQDPLSSGFTESQPIDSDIDPLEEGVSEGLEETPDDILEGLENLSDEELAILLEDNPGIADLLR